ncbi:hypothetical protein NM688_g292 [Phlebia brevispora]|uniref:Uncharacterized protein n=1 Tax=Phlebia brevispora TaxID=194682 RepID=A0ACC1TF23_9APHY|nr:hypothetical protein NM688_g292 [Phlebia brevispora]
MQTRTLHRAQENLKVIQRPAFMDHSSAAAQRSCWIGHGRRCSPSYVLPERSAAIVCFAECSTAALVRWSPAINANAYVDEDCSLTENVKPQTGRSSESEERDGMVKAIPDYRDSQKDADAKQVTMRSYMDVMVIAVDFASTSASVPIIAVAPPRSILNRYITSDLRDVQAGMDSPTFRDSCDQSSCQSGVAMQWESASACSSKSVLCLRKMRDSIVLLAAPSLLPSTSSLITILSNFSVLVSISLQIAILSLFSSFAMSQQYISDIKVVYNTEPINAVHEINGKGDNVNRGRRATPVYLQPVYTTHAEVACNSFRLVIQNSKDSKRSDLAKGACGAYRYLLPLSDMLNETKITSLGLLRLSSAITSLPSGYSGMSDNINKDRKGDYLYLIWKTVTVSFTQKYNLGLDVYYGSMPSQEPRSALTDINGGDGNINKDFGGSFVWLANLYINHPAVASVGFHVVIQNDNTPMEMDLAKGAGGQYRYIRNMRDQGIHAKITGARLLRSKSAVSKPPSGYDGMSTNINKGRGKSYLYVVWKTEEVQHDTRFVSGITVEYGSKLSQQSVTYVTDIHGGGDDINMGFHGCYVWISASYTSRAADACNSFVVVVQDKEDPDRPNLAKGAGGSYRYIVPVSDASNDRRITYIRLLRTHSAVSTPPNGYSGMSTNLNDGRGGDFLYLIWRDTTVPIEGQDVSGITVTH